MKKILLLTLLLITSLTANAEITSLTSKQFVGFQVNVVSRYPAIIKLRYGLDPNNLINVIKSDTLVKNYSFFNQLLPGNTYYWRVTLKTEDNVLIQTTPTYTLKTFRTP